MDVVMYLKAFKEETNFVFWILLNDNFSMSIVKEYSKIKHKSSGL